MSVDQALMNQLITDNIDIWTSTVKTKATTGRGSSKKLELYGVQKLRELILELAVRGKLVPQDQNDEPASVLLERIAEEKAQLVKEKKIKKPKKLPDITEEEAPFKLPKGWSFSRLENLCELITKGSSPKWQGVGYTENPEDVLFVTSENVGAFKLLLEKRKYVEKKFNEIEPRSILRKEDFLMNIVGASIGRTALYDIDDLANINQAVCLIRSFPQQVSTRFFLTFFNSLTCVSYMYDKQVENARPNLSMGNISKFVIPVPPIHEQHRIVAKVDELMKLCDQLEQQTEASIEAHQVLVTTLLDTLTNSANAEEMMQNWQMIADHFDTLFTTEESIEQLKQTILQLAVMGKLVPQDPTDEPAAKLLERIAQEKAQLIKENRIKKQKALPLIADDEKPFELPNGWSIERLGNICEKMGSGSTPRGGQSAYVAEGIPFLRSQNVWNGELKLNDIAYIPKETHDKMENTKVYPGDVLLNITGASLGRSTIFPVEIPEANVSQHVTIIRLIEPTMKEFVHLGIVSPLIQSLVWGRQVGMAIEGLSKKVLEQFEFPVPPLEEQKRIFLKVNELMDVCEQLKVKLRNSQTTQLHLTDAIFEQATGQVAKNEKQIQEEVPMEIRTTLTTTSEFNGQSEAVLAHIINSLEDADAKVVWSKSGMDLPNFYKQLKKEIDAGFINLPSKADYI
ncbi:TPA: restriction endonuclease subunit S [Vibrio parahaemolyticus]|uniref:restriction endonuclease subunit S n=1 Tax=Vibrio parahaemolyticus TaxID=670 RepID=UPI00042631BC|nr:restriction endonuclease subunit S [Vibrio parahaemolyticus]EJG2371830.1 restriction endonuclease subunit S [Vibrio parahaemolyticus]TOD41902.1 restriction endonuclease subunit S [Vibrio parahaemolyticus]TPA08895.1 restriction endonuclease subunit S [Vibrio parahaemolyticus]HBC3602922.1 restriction endonuclease subunit S [Vibrio parahaemolyticus]HCG5934732.1 restriction endonuclease subunit S [Vibrio parahaemolyticus]